jgi:hypothetical protein
MVSNHLKLAPWCGKLPPPRVSPPRTFGDVLEEAFRASPSYYPRRKSGSSIHDRFCSPPARSETKNTALPSKQITFLGGSHGGQLSDPNCSQQVQIVRAGTFLGGSHEGQLSDPNCPQKILFSNRQVQNVRGGRFGPWLGYLVFYPEPARANPTLLIRSHQTETNSPGPTLTLSGRRRWLCDPTPLRSLVLTSSRGTANSLRSMVLSPSRGMANSRREETLLIRVSTRGMATKAGDSRAMAAAVGTMPTVEVTGGTGATVAAMVAAVVAVMEGVVMVEILAMVAGETSITSTPSTMEDAATRSGRLLPMALTLASKVWAPAAGVFHGLQAASGLCRTLVPRPLLTPRRQNRRFQLKASRLPWWTLMLRTSRLAR